MTWLSVKGKRIAINSTQSLNPTSEFEKNAFEFIQQWQKGQQSFELNTSGSTGTPKPIVIHRDQMIASANATIKALALKTDENALLCMNSAFIGGKMMIVRALIHKMNLVLVEPVGDPLNELTDEVQFTAMVPLQVYNSLQNEGSYEKLMKFRTLLIGGGAVDRRLQDKIQKLETKVYSSYGMTETVSHIALKQLNGIEKDKSFRVLDGIKINTDDRDCLIINGSVTRNKDITTNDIVEIKGHNSFEWIGRADNVINTGGIKIQSEVLEAKIQSLLTKKGLNNAFFVIGKSDEKLGQRIELFIEADKVIEGIKETLEAGLNKFERPKQINYREQFALTPTGKIDKIRTTY